MATYTNGRWCLVSRPHGELKASDLGWREESQGALAPGEVLVRTLYLSLDPTHRIWMSDQEQYLPPLALGETIRGFGVGVVVASKDPKFAEGQLVGGSLGWQTHPKVPGAQLSLIPGKDLSAAEPYLAVYNHIGASAYFGLLDLGQPKEGETLVVSAAAGAVGSLVGQIGKIKGCRVVGIASSPEKCRWLQDELGFDAVIDRKAEAIDAGLARTCPKGIDVYFDNVGGEVLDTVLTRANLHARIPICGLISSYNEEGRAAGPAHFTAILMRRLRLEGFIVLDYLPRFPEAFAELAQWVNAGKLKYRLDVTEGIENVALGLQRMFAGKNTGKSVVRVATL